MLQAAVQFTLIPALRAAANGGERRRLLRREVVLVMTAIAAGSVAIWWLAPAIAHWFLSGRYDLNGALITAALVSGVLKVCSAFGLAAVIALGQDKDLRVLSAVSWGSIGLSVIAAFVAAPWGLVGVLYGISTGWLVRGVIATCMAIPHLRQTVEPATMGPPTRGSLAGHG
jgi:hypothetical protein